MQIDGQFTKALAADGGMNMASFSNVPLLSTRNSGAHHLVTTWQTANRAEDGAGANSRLSPVIGAASEREHQKNQFSKPFTRCGCGTVQEATDMGSSP